MGFRGKYAKKKWLNPSNRTELVGILTYCHNFSKWSLKTTTMYKKSSDLQYNLGDNMSKKLLNPQNHTWLIGILTYYHYFNKISVYEGYNQQKSVYICMLNPQNHKRNVGILTRHNCNKISVNGCENQ